MSDALTVRGGPLLAVLVLVAAIVITTLGILAIGPAFLGLLGIFLTAVVFALMLLVTVS